MKLLHDHIHEYDKIGRLLDVAYGKREKILRDFSKSAPDAKMNAIVNEWIEEKTSDVTWEHFIKAMKDGDLNKLAGEIIEFTEEDKTKQDYADVLEWVRK